MNAAQVQISSTLDQIRTLQKEQLFVFSKVCCPSIDAIVEISNIIATYWDTQVTVELDKFNKRKIEKVEREAEEKAQAEIKKQEEQLNKENEQKLENQKSKMDLKIS